MGIRQSLYHRCQYRTVMQSAEGQHTATPDQHPHPHAAARRRGGAARQRGPGLQCRPGAGSAASQPGQALLQPGSYPQGLERCRSQVLPSPPPFPGPILPIVICIPVLQASQALIPKDSGAVIGILHPPPPSPLSSVSPILSPFCVPYPNPQALGNLTSIFPLILRTR